MSKHHRSKAGRSHGGYARRLRRRGVLKRSEVMMPTLEQLRRTQARRTERTNGRPYDRS